jgi:hypothetical protein
MHRHLTFAAIALLACASSARANTFLTDQLEKPIDAALRKLGGLDSMGSWGRARAARRFGNALDALQDKADRLNRDYNDLAMKTLVRDIQALSKGLASGRLTLAETGRGLIFARAKVDTGLAELQRRSKFYFGHDLPRALRSEPTRLTKLKTTMIAADRNGWSAGRVMSTLGKDFMERYPGGTIGWALVKRAHARTTERVARRWTRDAWRRLSGDRAPASRDQLKIKASKWGNRAVHRAIDAEKQFRGLSGPASVRR